MAFWNYEDKVHCLVHSSKGKEGNISLEMAQQNEIWKEDRPIVPHPINPVSGILQKSLILVLYFLSATPALPVTDG